MKLGGFLVLIGGAAAVAAFILWPKKAPAAITPSGEIGAPVTPEAITTPQDELLTGGIMGWIDQLTNDARDNEIKYRPAISAAEIENGIPRGLLARLLYQESRYRTDIITGTTRSRTGAVGIAQFMPATAAEMGVNPLDPFSSINGAARYLARMFKQFGRWDYALMAYNWGPGNVASYIRSGYGTRGQEIPKETTDYVAQITKDWEFA